jgi:hypothetical protein
MAKPKAPVIPYANTTTSVAKSKHDIDKLLAKYGVTELQWTTSGNASCLRFQFKHDGRVLNVRFMVDPGRQGIPWKGGMKRNRDAHAEHESMRLHRTLYWCIKSKLEAIESGLETPLSVWLPAIESAGGATVAEVIDLHIDQLAAPGGLNQMLALPPARG